MVSRVKTVLRQSSDVLITVLVLVLEPVELLPSLPEILKSCNTLLKNGRYELMNTLFTSKLAYHRNENNNNNEITATINN